MSTPQSTATGAEDDSSTTAPARPTRQLRPLAPKPPNLVVRPALQRSRTAPSLKGLSCRFKPSPAACPACGQATCRLPTHRAFSATARSSASSSSGVTETAIQHPDDPTYSQSYGYAWAMRYAYVDPAIAASRIDPFFDLPVENSPEMHRLFFDYFTIECARGVNVPRPAEMATEVIHSPFFVPAMLDPALCFSVLAFAAAAIPHRNGLATRNVTALTLIGNAMQALRERMNMDPEHITDSTIVAATFLWGCNSLMADPVAMKTHAASVRALVHARGGLHRLGMAGAAAVFISWIDILHCMLAVEPCHFHDAPNPGPFQPPPPRVYGAYFESRRAAALLDPRIIEICLDSCRSSEALDKATDTGLLAADYMLLLSRMRYSAIQRSIIHAEFDDSGTVNECAILATAFFHMNAFHHPIDQKMLILDKSRRFVAALRRTGGPSFWAKDPELLIWMLFMAVLVPHDFEDRDWCMDLITAALRSRFGDGDWPLDWQEQILQDYLLPLIWSVPRGAEPFGNVCRTIRQRRTPEEEEKVEGEDEEQ